ncbi:MAG: type I-E CRISPR-associated protein Cse1/CasA, partial [Candidatus Riflebacteria bacterium]|nr:type I-E CRISPR-associated protein Cse1/CasA [Candidatus Riflebacteria bacterium]
AYFAVDLPFREWLAGLRPENGKEEKIAEWKDTLKKIIFEQADKLLENAGNRDFLGKKISEKGKSEEIYNIMHAYNKFKNWLLSPKVLGKQKGGKQ